MRRFAVLFSVFSFFLFMLLLGLSLKDNVEGASGYVGADTCKGCHEDKYDSYAQSVHGKKNVPNNPANKSACESCHGPGASHASAGGGKGVGAVISFSSKRVSAETKSAACLACHETFRNLALWNMGQHKKNDVACPSCHTMHTTKSVRQFEI